MRTRKGSPLRVEARTSSVRNTACQGLLEHIEMATNIMRHVTRAAVVIAAVSGTTATIAAIQERGDVRRMPVVSANPNGRHAKVPIVPRWYFCTGRYPRSLQISQTCDRVWPDPDESLRSNSKRMVTRPISTGHSVTSKWPTTR
jgi:hypothetical protein